MNTCQDVAEKFKVQLEALKRRSVADPPPAHCLPKCVRCGDTTWIQMHGGVMRCPDCFLGSREVAAPSVPQEFRTALLSNYKVLNGGGAAVKAAKAWLQAGVGDLYLFGGVGCGKTRLACSLLNETYQERRDGMFTRTTGLLFLLQPSKEEGRREAMWRQVRETPILVLDDIGAERDTATDFTSRTILQIYEDRYDHGLRTIWTSNKSLEELSKQMEDDRLVSRIAGRSIVAELLVTDQRIVRRDRDVGNARA